MAGEGAAAFAACLAASVVANARLLRSDVVSDDALVHQFWMRHWQDPGLFNDPLTTQLRESVRYPDGYQALFWLTTHGFDPIAFGEWLGVGLMALSGWLVFRIVREQETLAPRRVDRRGAVPLAAGDPSLRRRVPARVRAARGAAHRAAGDAAPGRRRGGRGRRRRAVLSARRRSCGRRAGALGRARAEDRRAASRVRRDGGRGPADGRARAAAAGGRRAAGDERRGGAGVPRIRPPRDAALLRRLPHPLPEPEPQRVRPALAREHPRRRRARAAGGEMARRPPAGARGAGDAGRVAGRFRAGAARAVPALPPPPLHVSARRVLRDRGGRSAAAAVPGGRAPRPRHCSPARPRSPRSPCSPSRWRRRRPPVP